MRVRFISLFLSVIGCCAEAVESNALIQLQRTIQASQSKIPLLLHRVMLPRADGGVQCDGLSPGGESGEMRHIAEQMLETRDNFYAHNSGWSEYVWGQDSIEALLAKSQSIFQNEEGLEDFVKVFNGMDEWMYQQDTIRHLILYHFGGVYLDLDMDCRVDLFDIIGNHSLVIRGGGKTNFLAAEPRHPFFLKMLKRISKTFRDGVGDLEHRWSAIHLTGEKQICATMKEDFGFLCWMCGPDGVEHDLGKFGSVKLVGSKEIDNWDADLKCAHKPLNAWSVDVLQPVAEHPKTEKELAQDCPAVYDTRTTWGSELVKIASNLSA